ncbi:PREDICTED: integrin alpha-IIb-like [Nanorana parkeri]|uniref:integrin alpha-IIb-like n=1 Tax=Nanorana parkeri TaxID=125878 RepID=UPI0008540EFF|nr:PREDICTED: integrin alpha-IIb-like [Nanorana parkeri]
MMLCLLPLILPYTHALNLDKLNPHTFSGPRGSYFGFSFDFYQSADSSMNIVVGAPKLNASVSNARDGGGVFFCPWGSQASSCTILHFDQSGDTFQFGESRLTVLKSNQWLGATVRTWKSSIVACAPLQEFNYVDMTGESGNTPTGACYYTEDLKSFHEFAPCRQLKTDFYAARDNRYCEIGFSTDISKKGVLLAGGPGGYYFEGLFVTVPLSSMQTKSAAMIKEFPGLYMSEEDKHVSNAYKDSRTLFILVAIITKTESFAVAYGEFTGDDSPGRKLFLAVQFSQARECSGKIEETSYGVWQERTKYHLVLIFSGKIRVISIRGEQTASYFGHSVAVTDINGDGLDDLLVGAPVFMERRTDGKFLEVGQVYVYLQKKPRALNRDPQILRGTRVYGHFGASIAPLGDLDQDGYNDVAVGSPFGGQSGAGCVYIYKGEKSGLSTQPSQILESPQKAPSRFGFALRGGEDIDQNGYPDLVVGAFEADTVYVFRAQPVVLLHTSLIFTPDTVDPDLKKCKQAGIGDVSCFNVSVCVWTSGKSLPKTISLSADIQLDSQKSRFLRRTLFTDSSQPSKKITMDIQSNSQRTCTVTTAYLRGENEFKDKLSPIVVSVNFSLNTAPSSSVLPPIIHGNTFLQEQIHILLDCGEDNICIPDLQLSASWGKEPLVIGDDNLAQIHFDAENLGEGAYEAELHVTLPPGAHYMQIEGETEEKILCTPRKMNDSELVVCELGNPLRNEAQIHAGLLLSISDLEDSEGNFSFPMQIKSRNSQNSSSPVVWVHLNVTVKISLGLLGNSHPSDVVLPLPNWKPKEESNKPLDKGEIVTHVYELHNAGPGTVHVKLVIQSPEHFDGDIFLYPMQLKTDDNLNCTIAELNFLQLDVVEPTKIPSNFSKGDDHRLNKREVSSMLQDGGNAETDNSTNAKDGPQNKQPITLSCVDSGCWTAECFIEDLGKGQRVTVALESILWISSFMKRPQQPFNLTSRGYFQVIGVPYRIKPMTVKDTEKHTVTVVQWVTLDGQKEIPLWWIILGVLGGLLILALFVFVMWKLGFFRRMRPPSDDQEDLTEAK